ncbi:MAG TPA: hypothetical protein VFW41_11840 [Gaiellaceae bacterium]|nr:hypothetical protein [Gaiellaceae bacterium]
MTFAGLRSLFAMLCRRPVERIVVVPVVIEVGRQQTASLAKAAAAPAPVSPLVEAAAQATAQPPTAWLAERRTAVSAIEAHLAMTLHLAQAAHDAAGQSDCDPNLVAWTVLEAARFDEVMDRLHGFRLDLEQPDLAYELEERAREGV